MSHAFNWVELPSIDFDRAVGFYSTVLDNEIEVFEPDPESCDDSAMKCGMFPAEEGEVGGMIVATDEYTTDSGETIPYTPTTDSGPVVYLSIDSEIEDALARVKTAGGDVLHPAEPIPDFDGYYALVSDTEGNRVGLMSEE